VANPVVQQAGPTKFKFSAGAITVSLPSPAPQAGDLAILFGAMRTLGQLWVAPGAPWVQLFSQGATSMNLTAWGIICTGSDTNPTIDCNASTAANAQIITFRPPPGYQWLALASVLDDLTAYTTLTANDLTFQAGAITPTNAAASGNPFVTTRFLARNTDGSASAISVSTSTGFSNTAADTNNCWGDNTGNLIHSIESRVDQSSANQPGGTVTITWSPNPAVSDAHDSVAFTLKTTPSSAPQPIPFSRTQFFIADTIVM